MGRSSVLVKKGHYREIRDKEGKLIAEEVVCLGWCNGTFFRKGGEIGKKAVRRCKDCRNKSASPRCAWVNNWSK